MRFLFVMSIVAGPCVASVAAQTPNAGPQFSDDLALRSDSLRRLKPARELEAAIARDDWRFVGVRGYVVVAPGVAFGDPFYPENPNDINVIEGTSDFVVGEAGERLNQVAAEYAEQYNHLLLKRLRKAGKQ